LDKIYELREKNYNADNESILKKQEKSESGMTSSMTHFYFNEAGIEADMNLLPINKEKSCCWTCLKVLLKDQAIDKHYEEKIIKLKVVKNKTYIKIKLN